jgi:hypothetical protein
MLPMSYSTGDFRPQGHDPSATPHVDVMGMILEDYAVYGDAAGYKLVEWKDSTARADHKASDHQTGELGTQRDTEMQTQVDNMKRPASMSPSYTLDLMRAKDCTEGNSNGATDSCTVTETMSRSGARDEAQSISDSSTSQSDKQVIGAINIDNDDELEVLEDCSSPSLKRKSSVVLTPSPAEKRAKHKETIEILDGDSEVGAEKSTQNDSPTSLKRADALQDGAGPVEGESKRVASESGGDARKVAQDQQAAQKLAKANKDLEKACRNCKADANKALKTKHEQEISKLKKGHREELADAKKDASRTLRDTKSTAKHEKQELKNKCEDQCADLKSQCDKKLADVKEKYLAKLCSMQEDLRGEREKTKELTNELNILKDQKKKTERSAAAKVKVAEEDLKAGELQLKEGRKQLLRETREEVAMLKPEHSKIVKEKDKAITGFAQDIVDLEQKLKQSDSDLRKARLESLANKKRYDDCKAELTQAKKAVSAVESNLIESEKYAKSVDQRTDGKLARVQEKLDLQEANLREHASRVITLTRENFTLKDTLTNVAARGREKRDEVERLKAELNSTKAELGVAKGMEEL